MTRRVWILLLVVLGLAAAIALPERVADPDLSAQVLMNNTPVPGFTRAEGPRSFTFPADFGPHPDYQTEWWYYTGHLESETGQRFGYQLTFFRRALIPQDRAAERPSEWATEQIYMAHFALTDIGGEEFYASERFARGAAGLAGAQSSPYRVWLEDWYVEQTGEGEFRMQAAGGGIALDLHLVAEKEPVLHGEQGYSRKGPEAANASYYYSQTRLATQGIVHLGAEAFNVEGLSWKDHEFSTSALSSEQQGWDWFSIQLDNGYELMVFQLRHRDGSIDPYSSGTLVAPDGSVRHLSREEFSIEMQDEWRSPHSGASYPMGWVIRVPSADLELELQPLLRDQELDLSFIYWEGAVQVLGRQAGAAVNGQGYVEMTGYAEAMGGQF